MPLIDEEGRRQFIWFARVMSLGLTLCLLLLAGYFGGERLAQGLATPWLRWLGLGLGFLLGAVAFWRFSRSARSALEGSELAAEATNLGNEAEDIDAGDINAEILDAGDTNTRGNGGNGREH